MKKLMSLKAVLATLILSFSLAASAGPHHPEHYLEMMQKQLELSDDQVTAIREVMKNNKPKKEAIHNKLKTLKKDLHQQMKAENVDANAIKSINQKIASQKSDLMLLKLNARKEIAAQLSSQQLEKFKEFKAKMQKRMKHRREHKED